MYVYVSSQDSKDVYPDNSNKDFTVDLVQPLIFQHVEEWEVALVEIDAPLFTIDGVEANYYILSDVVDISTVSIGRYPILRRSYIPPKTTLTREMIGDINTSRGNSTLEITSTGSATTDRDRYVFDKPFYIPVKNSYIERIGISLRSLTFGDLDVIIGDIFVTLHFRRKTLTDPNKVLL